MKIVLFRRGDADSEAGVKPWPELVQAMGNHFAALEAEGRVYAGEGLKPSSQAVRVTFKDGKAVVTDGPFAEAREVIAGISLIDMPDMEAAAEWLKQWPVEDAHGHAEIEVRDLGCPGGLPGFGDPAAPGEGRRYAVMLLSTEAAEADFVPPKEVLAKMADANRRGHEAGHLIAGEGLKSSRSGKRVKFTGGKPQVIDGPFAEVKELVAGFWIVRAASIAGAIAWAESYPFPGKESATVEIRQLYEPEELFGP
jgi:hypothetical protein